MKALYLTLNLAESSGVTYCTKMFHIHLLNLTDESPSGRHTILYSVLCSVTPSSLVLVDAGEESSAAPRSG